jgi:hypothetical protein
MDWCRHKILLWFKPSYKPHIMWSPFHRFKSCGRITVKPLFLRVSAHFVAVVVQSGSTTIASAPFQPRTKKCPMLGTSSAFFNLMLLTASVDVVDAAPCFLLLHPDLDLFLSFVFLFVGPHPAGFCLLAHPGT